jgi:hypothetical protein
VTDGSPRDGGRGGDFDERVQAEAKQRRLGRGGEHHPPATRAPIRTSWRCLPARIRRYLHGRVSACRGCQGRSTRREDLGHGQRVSVVPAGWVRRRWAAVANRSAALSTSAVVVQRPSDRRTAPSARSRSRPIAVRTGEGSVVPLWQADPVEAASCGTAASRSLPVTPVMAMLRVLGSRRSGWPLRCTAPGRAVSSVRCSRSRSPVSRGWLVSRLAWARSAAAPSATA